MNRLFPAVWIGALLLSGFSAPSAMAQSRMNDHDVAATMKNLKEDAKSFRSAFDHSVHKTSIRRTSQEKSAKSQVKTFEHQTHYLLENFKDKKQGGNEL